MARFLLLAFLMLGSFALEAQTSLAGKVTEAETGEPVLFGTVAVYRDDVLVTGGETDFDGNYSINPLDPGTYDVEFSYVGLGKKRITGVLVAAGKSNTLNAELGGEDDGAITLEDVVVVAYTVPLVEQDNTTQGGIVTDKDIKNLPTRNINALAAQVAGIGSTDEGMHSRYGGRVRMVRITILMVSG